MKRKELEDANDDFYFHSSKSRRLDADLFASVNEDPRNAHRVFEEMPPPGATGEMETDALKMEEPLPSGDQKALVIYNPANTPFLKAPDSRDFSVIVNSDLIPGLKDHIFSWGNSKLVKPAKGLVAEEEKKEDSNGCLAVVPWVASNMPLASQAPSLLDPMEAEEAEMMDTDDNNYNGTEASEFRGNMGGQGGLQHWQQHQLHWMEPQLFQNTPIT